MNNVEAEHWRNQQIAATDYRTKLCAARERKGLTIHEASELVDLEMRSSAYYDIERCDYDLTDCYSLTQIKRLCEHFDIHPRELFCDETTTAMSMSDLIEKMKARCLESKCSIAEFEDIVGWELEDNITNPLKALEVWKVDCLIAVSHELGIDWRCVIAGL